jgi:hypothetical protein
MKILVIGNSHVGAIRKGCEFVTNKVKEIELGFIASHSDNLLKAKILDGVIVKAHHYFGSSDLKVNEYDAFVVLGTLPPIRTIFNRLLSSSYSEQLIDTALHDIFEKTIDKHIVENLIRPHSDRPIILLSYPERRNNNLQLNSKDYEKGVLLINQLTSSYENVFYCPQSLKTLNDYYQPLGKFYDSPISIKGETHNDIGMERKAIGHMNHLGGIEQMKCIVDTIELVLNNN